MNDILTFTIVALLLVISPGPNGALIIKTVTSHAKHCALINLFGIACATFMHGALSIFGLSALILQSAELFLLIKMLGAAYLFYIGFKGLRTSFYDTHERNEKNNLNRDTTASEHVQSVRSLSLFNEGFLTQLLNPKVSMFYLAAFPQFIGFEAAAISDAFILVVIHALLIITWFVLVIMLVDKIKRLHTPKSALIKRWTQRLSGGVMIYFSALLIMQR